MENEKNVRRNYERDNMGSSFLHELLDMQKRVTKLEIIVENQPRNTIEGSNSTNKQNNSDNKELENKIRDLNEKNNNLLNSKAELESRIKKLTDENEGLRHQISTLNNEKEEIISEKEKLYKIAYEDKKCDVMNENAFNKTLREYKDDIKKITLILFSMKDTKKSNQIIGKKETDNRIKHIAKVLSVAYGKENVFRALGDQFYVLCNTDSEKVSDEYINNIIYSIMNNDIKVVYAKENGSEENAKFNIILQKLDLDIKNKVAERANITVNNNSDLSMETNDYKPNHSDDIRPSQTQNDDDDDNDDWDDEIIASSLTASALDKYLTQENDTKDDKNDDWDDEDYFDDEE